MIMYIGIDYASIQLGLKKNTHNLSHKEIQVTNMI